eukprot:9502313-Pyramimonas_sp.AAC.1
MASGLGHPRQHKHSPPGSWNLVRVGHPPHKVFTTAEAHEGGKVRTVFLHVFPIDGGYSREGSREIREQATSEGEVKGRRVQRREKTS